MTSERIGVQWKLQPDGALSTTKAGKAVWRAAALAAGSPELAAAIGAEPDWRHKYARHLIALAELMAKSRSRSLAGARAGLGAFEETFELLPGPNPEPGGAPLPLYAAVRARAAAGPSLAFGAAAVRSSGQRACAPGAALPGVDPLALFRSWAAHGVCEPSACEAVEALLGAAGSAGQRSLLGSHIFVCLGGTSEMGPARTLLALGATVVAIARRGAKLQELIRFARGHPPADGAGAGAGGGLAAAPSAGTLIVPVPLRSAPAGDTSEAGCDMLRDSAEIAAWLAALDGNGGSGADAALVAQATAASAAAAHAAAGGGPAPVPAGSGDSGAVLVLGSYGYLDGAEHVRLSAAMDAIVLAVLAARPPKRTAAAFLPSPSTAAVIPAEARDASAARYEASGLLSLRALRTPNARAPVAAEDGCADSRGRFVCDGLATLQGPSYALAKTCQQWRAALLADEGRCAAVSSLFAPGARTQSMVHVPTLSAALDGLEAFAPLRVPHVPVAAYAMALLLLHTLRHPQVRAPHSARSREAPRRAGHAP